MVQSVDGEWRTRYNHELYSLYKDDQVTKKIRVQRLRWLGHLARMNDENVAKRVFERNPEGRRRRGRPKLRWKDSVLEDEPVRICHCLIFENGHVVTTHKLI